MKKVIIALAFVATLVVTSCTSDVTGEAVKTDTTACCDTTKTATIVDSAKVAVDSTK